MKFALKLKHCRYPLYVKSFEHGNLILCTEITYLDLDVLNLILAAFNGVISFKILKFVFPCS